MDRETVDAYWWKYWRKKGDDFEEMRMYCMVRDAYTETTGEEYRSPYQRGDTDEPAGRGESDGS